MGFGMEFLRWVVERARRSRVSEMVVEGWVERRWMRDSMAAMGMVRSGSVERRCL